MSFFELLAEAFPRLLAGLGSTIVMTFVSLLFAIVIGLISCLMAISHIKVLKGISSVFVDIIRGTPLLVQAFFVYFGLTQALNIRLSSEVAGVITLSLNAGAYLSEIFRGGIQAVPVGQMEASRSLGLPYSRAMIKVILPQAVRIIIPSLVNQFIITLKDTSIISVIGLRELTQAGKIIIASNFRSFEVWAMVAVMYLVIILLLSKLSKYIERKIAYGKGKR